MKRMVLLLVGVMVLSGLILAGTYSGLLPRIEENRRRALNASLTSLFGTAATLSFGLVPSEDALVYEGRLPDGQLRGYAVQVEAQGYGGAMTLLVGLSADLTTTEGIEVVEQLETPGLGGRISEDAFRSQFKGLDPRVEILYVKNVEPAIDRNEIQAISGATITSRAVVRAINAQVPRAIDNLEGQAQ